FDSHLRLFHLDNEPNAHWWKAGKSGKDYGNLFNVVARALHAKYPDILIGGPVLLWPPAFPPSQPGQPNWYTWPQWTVPFLDAALDQSDFFDFHHYDSVSREDRSEYIESALEEVNLISNEMARRGKIRPVAITECGLGLTAEDWQDPARHWRRRTYPWAHFLISLLERPDKVMTVQMHDLCAVAGQWYKFLADDSDGFNMAETIDPKKLQNQPPTYWLYWLLRHTRGTRLVASESNCSGLTMLATRRQTRSGDEAAVLLLNDRDTPRTVNVNFLGVPASVAVRWDRLYLADPANEVVHESGKGVLPRMPPRSLMVAYISVPAETPLHPVQERLELYGDATLQEFPEPGSPGVDRPDASVVIPVVIPAAALLGATSVGVYVGTQGNAAQDRITMVLDGQSYPLKGGTYFQNVPLRSLPTAGRQVVRFTLNHREGAHRLRISCIMLKIERQIAKNDSP
ncbi:MAG: glycosyl hydrolase family 39, partial [Pedosphaera sp.]|nr:glycosyl hydrolase family 39 [Pedosphaera sp.]